MGNIIYVKLLEEGIDSWRPVPAVKLEDSTYLLKGEDIYDPEDEVWEFKPGTEVVVEKRILSGESCLVATAIVS